MHDHREKDEHCFCGFQNTIFNSVRAAGNAAQLCCFGASRGFILYRYRLVIVVVGLTAGVVGDSFKNHHEHSHQQGEKQRELLMHSVEICLDTPPNYWAGLWGIRRSYNIGGIDRTHLVINKPESDSLLGAGDTAVNKTKFPVLVEFTQREEEMMHAMN